MAQLQFPANPSIGEKIEGSNNIIYRWDGEKWITEGSKEANDPGGGGDGASVSVGGTPPPDAEQGDLWFEDADTLRLYVYYNDGSSSQWVDASPDSDPESKMWTKNGSTLEPKNEGDDVSTDGNLICAGPNKTIFSYVGNANPTSNAFGVYNVDTAKSPILLKADGSITANSLELPNGPAVPYQEGTWTPYAAATNDFNKSGISAYNNQLGNWTRIGNLITCHWWMQADTSAWSYQNGTGASDNFYISGLPYRVNPTDPFGTGTGVISYMQGNSFQNANTQALTFRCYPQTGSPTLIVFVYSDFTQNPPKDMGASYGMTFGNLSSGIQGSVSYMTDDTTWTPANGATKV